MDMSLIHSIAGTRHGKAIELLYRLAGETKLPRILELGSFVGKSAIIMATALKEKHGHGTVVCCDRFAKNIQYWGAGHPVYKDSYKSFWEYARQAKVEDYIITICGEIDRLQKMLCGKFGLIYIDAGHTVDQVLPNALFAWDNLIEDGVLLFDDYNNNPDYKWRDVKLCVDVLKDKWGKEFYCQEAMMVGFKK